MNGKRDQLISIRFTKPEREIIEKIAENRKSTMTDFIREAIFSHIYNLEKKDVNNINFEEIITNVKEISKSTKVINKNLQNLKESLKITDLKEFDEGLMNIFSEKSRDIEF
jgi:uncharacterized protein (DUF1778 family)